MKVIKSLLLVAAFSILTLCGATLSHAQEAGRHPAYFRALSDLRMMRGYLDGANPHERHDPDLQRAMSELDAAIQDIKDAIDEDRHSHHDHDSMDDRMPSSARYRRARDAGNAAWHDLESEHDYEFGHGLKTRTMNHIEEANHAVDRIIRRIH